MASKSLTPKFVGITVGKVSTTPPGESPVASQTLRAFVVVSVLWVVGWYLEAQSVVVIALRSMNTAVETPLFPGLLASPIANLVVYLLPLVGCLFYWKLNRLGALIIAGLFASSTTFLLFHINLFTEARHVSFFWTALWLVWLALNFNRTDGNLRREAEWITKSTIAMVFFCAAVGKWTAGFWSGELFYDIYFLHSENSFYPWLRAHTDTEQLRLIAAWYSRLVVLSETFLFVTIFLRFRYFAVAALAVVTGTIIGAGFGQGVGALMLPMMAIVAACFFLGTTGNEREGSSDNKIGLSTSFRVLIVAHIGCVAASLIMSISPPLQKIWMKQHHISEENRLVWGVVHVIPKMYSFENKLPYIEESAFGSSEESNELPPLTSCFVGETERQYFQHYPSRIITSPLCLDIFFKYPQPVTVIFESRYRSTCLQSRLEVRAVEEGKERTLTFSKVEILSKCDE